MKTAIRIIGTVMLGVTLLTPGCASDRAHRSLGESIDDTAIKTKLKTAMMNDPEIKSSTINTDVVRGEITLRGTVRSEQERKKAEDTAKGLKGVRGVYNELTVVAEPVTTTP